MALGRILVYTTAGITAAVAATSAYRTIKGTAFPTIIGTKLELKDSQFLTHDVKLLTFALPKDSKGAGIAPGKAILAQVTNPSTKSTSIRPYSPIYTAANSETLQIAVKNLNTKGVSGGLHQLIPGDHVTFRGPLPIHNIDFESLKSVNLIAGGSGITPFYSVINHMLKERPGTRVNLIFANKTADDIIFKERLDELQNNYQDRFKVTYVIGNTKGMDDKTPQVYSGRIDDALLDQIIWRDSSIFVCGPDGMTKALRSTLRKNNDKVVIF